MLLGASLRIVWFSIALAALPATGVLASVPPPLAGVLAPPASIRLRPSRSAIPLPDWEQLLFARLDAGDHRLLPRLVRLPGGRTAYVHRRRPGEPPLNPGQIQALLRNPPTYRRERLTIRALLDQLRRLGVRLELTAPRQQGAAGEWEPRRATIRIRPNVANAGSVTFARVLNHEAIHVAQSCRAGGLSRSPAPLGLSRQLDQEGRQLMAGALYAGAPARIRVVEEEAYAQQKNLSVGPSMLAVHCGRAGVSPGRLGR